MKRTYSILLWVVIFQALVCSSFAVSKDDKPSGKARVVSIVGDAISTNADGKSMALKRGMILTTGDTITTGKGATVTLDLGQNGNQLVVQSDSTLAIERLEVLRTGADTVIETRLEVKKGSILGDVKKLPRASNYSVKTANGVAAIRGTGFRIYAIGIFLCRSGQLLVTLSTPGQPPRAFTVNGGQGFDGSKAVPTVTVLTAQELGALIGEITVIIPTDPHPPTKPLHTPPPIIGHPNPPGPAAVGLVSLVVREAQERGLSPSQVNLVASSFSANGFSTAGTAYYAIYPPLRLDDRFFTIYFEAVLTPVYGVPFPLP